MIDLYMDTRWTALKNSVKSWVSGTFEAPEGGSWQDGWEFFAVMTETGDSFHTGLIERDIVDPACESLCGELGEVELTALLSWLWNEYTEANNPGVEHPWQMDMQRRRKALSVVLNRHMLIEANSDGAEIEERSFRESWGEEDKGGHEGQDA